MNGIEILIAIGFGIPLWAIITGVYIEWYMDRRKDDEGW